MLKNYLENVQLDDLSNREGHAAKVYFNQLFGKDFTRSSPIFINTILNYGYTILLSHFNRLILASGYLTQIGIHHKSEYNPYNFACDLMEPFRPIIDRYAITGKLNEENYKKCLSNFDSVKVRIKQQNTNLENAIKIYCLSVFRALNENNPNLIVVYEDYEF